MRDGVMTWEAPLAAQNTKPALQLANVQKHVATILRPLPDHRSNLSSDISSGFQDLFRHLLDLTPENVQSRQREIRRSVTEALARFEQIFQTLDSELPKKLCNS